MLLPKVCSLSRVFHSTQLLKNIAPSWRICRFVTTEKPKSHIHKKRPIIVAPKRRQPLPETFGDADSVTKKKISDIPPYVQIKADDSKFVLV